MMSEGPAGNGAGEVKENMMNRKKAAILSAVLFGASMLFVPQADAAKSMDAAAAEPVGSMARAENPANFEGFVWRLDNDGKNVLPRNFRTSEDAFHAPDKKFHLDASYVPSRAGMDRLHISGSSAFTPAQLKNVAAKLREKTAGPIYDVDLRQESHGFLDGIPVSWYGDRDWANLGKSQRGALADERRRLRAAVGKTVYIAPLGKHKMPEGGLVRRVKKAETEQQVAQAAGMHYFRIAATDHIWPTTDNIDRFIAFYRALPTDAWLHFHCEAGVGRTTAYMVMTDMLKNPEVSLKDILYRQHEIGGFYYGEFPIKTKEKDTWKEKYYKEKVTMIAHFYRYVQENHATGYATPWSVWLKNHPAKA